MANLSAEQLRRLARLGAMARLEQIRAEEAAIRAEFPELFGRGARREESGREGGRQRRDAGGVGPAMSAAGRKAVSERMRKYWAEQRKAKGSK